ncbi:MAG: hypothetical protein ABJM43_04260 [Paracoccaceae bacterium]
MELITLLEMLRSNYLLEFESVYRNQLEVNEEVHPEIAFKISDGVYKRLFVVDFFGKNGANTNLIEVGTTNAAYGGGQSFEYSSLSIEFGHVSWDDMRLELDPMPQDIVGFEPWFDRWIDLDGAYKKEGAFLSHVIHSALIHDDSVGIDFGTAPRDAFVQLLDLFKANGVETIRISSDRKYRRLN